MMSVQPWMVIVGTVAGAAVGVAAASGWWWARLKRARRLIDRIEASRQLLNEQTTQARRQIERMQLELGELRLIAERMRRKAALASMPHDSAEGPDSILPLEALAPAHPELRAPEKPRAPSIASIDAALEREESRRERAADGGFARTEIQDDGGPNSRGFMPTQLDKPF